VTTKIHLQGRGGSGNDVDEERVERDAHAIHQGGRNRFQTRGEFLNVVDRTSLPQMKALFAAYPNVREDFELVCNLNDEMNFAGFWRKIDNQGDAGRQS
jgi:hypothetical protein